MCIKQNRYKPNYTTKNRDMNSTQATRSYLKTTDAVGAFPSENF